MAKLKKLLKKGDSVWYIDYSSKTDPIGVKRGIVEKVDYHPDGVWINMKDGGLALQENLFTTQADAKVAAFKECMAMIHDLANTAHKFL